MIMSVAYSVIVEHGVFIVYPFNLFDTTIVKGESDHRERFDRGRI